MIALEGRIVSRKNAPFHVQFALDKSQGESSIPGYMEIKGRVVKVFRGDGRLAIGDQIEFLLYVCRPGEEPTGPAFVYHDEFFRYTYMEAYLFGSPPKCELAAYEFTMLPGPSEKPTMSVDQLEALLRSIKPSNAKRWWEFWRA